MRPPSLKPIARCHSIASLSVLAEELTIAPATVRTHAQNALRKLGARNRPHAIALAMQANLIDLPPAPPTSAA